MKRMVALLRAVNVGGTGKLPMADLVRLCEDAGFEAIRTYIASGNVVFSTNLSPERARTALEDKLAEFAGKRIAVFVRDAKGLQRILDGNPFADSDAKFTVAVFLAAPPPHDALAHATGSNDEEMRLGEREIYVHYPNGMGKSKLKIPAAEGGTARNMNTIAKLCELASKD
jgi:uncharacterized protein (DUF1697 family)